MDLKERNDKKKTEENLVETYQGTSLPEKTGTIAAYAKDIPPDVNTKGEKCGSSSAFDESPDNGYIYAVGKIKAHFPNMGLEKEFLQVVREGKTINLTDQQVIYEILSKNENAYLAREICFVFAVENVDTYILKPFGYHEVKQLIEAIRPSKGLDCDVIIGTRGPIAPANLCNGLQIPMVLCDKIYSFDVDSFVNAIPQPPNMEHEAFKNAAEELFLRIIQLTDNVGAMDEHRAVNYLAMRYPTIYALAFQMQMADKSISMVEVQPSRLNGIRKIANVIFSYVDRKTDVIEKYFVRVDITEKYPFLVSKLQPFYDR